MSGLMLHSLSFACYSDQPYFKKRASFNSNLIGDELSLCNIIVFIPGNSLHCLTPFYNKVKPKYIKIVIISNIMERTAAMPQ